MIKAQGLKFSGPQFKSVKTAYDLFKNNFQFQQLEHHILSIFLSYLILRTDNLGHYSVGMYQKYAYIIINTLCHNNQQTISKKLL